MQRRTDDPGNPGQRSVMPGDRFSRVLNPGAPQRFDGGDGQMTSMQYTTLGSYSQMSQAAQHLQPTQTVVHTPVCAAALSAVHQTVVTQPPNIHQPPTIQSPATAVIPMAQPVQLSAGLTGPAVGQQQQQQFQRLKVEDALSYLDQVKLQFGNQPSVYNDFLDIMKEFKSQTIDTPGVINRVSNLFKGHPDLIVGFNTFLPPGYKIEVERDVINVYQPGQASMPISALGSTLSAAAPQQLSSQVQKSPAHISAAAIAPPTQVPAPPVHHSYTQPPRPAHTDGHLPLPHQAPPSAGMPVASAQGGGSQPVEFNHAINYVNKIKNRFQGQPEVYKQFLEILHTYQKEQRTLKEGMGSVSNKPLTETEVYQQVARLFQNQEDLLTEFGQFLPDANGQGGYFFGDSTEGRRSSSDMALGVRNDHSSTVKKPGFASKTAPPGKANVSQLKRPQSGGSSSQQPPSKIRRPDYHDDMSRGNEGIKYRTGMLKDVSIAEAGKHGTLKEYAFFDQVRNALRSSEVYNNFLRCLVLFNMEVISRSELINMVHPFLGKFPDLLKFFKELLGHKDCGSLSEIIPQGVTKDRGMRDDCNMEIDFQTCKRYGASYRALPSTYVQPKCSGRTQLCREVLNDTWVSIPTWSEDSTFVTSRKSMFEEQIYKTEDERFELDMVIETNLAAIKTLEYISKKMQRMTPEEAAKFRLDNSLGGSSEFVARKAIIRIYGEKSADIIDGLKKNPVVAVPLVLRRLKAKDEEWCEAKKGFNKLWQEQNQKYYLKSLDHQGIAFKQNDIKALRSKALINEIEAIMEEQSEANQQGQNVDMPDPHIREHYEDKTVFDDAASIIIHNMKRQSNMHHDDKKKIKQLVLYHFRDFLFHPRGDLSDDEDDGDEDGDGDKPADTGSSDSMSRPTPKEKEAEPATETQLNGHYTPLAPADASAESSQQGPCDLADMDMGDDDDDQYILFFGNTNWYLFFRLHFKLCQRLLLYRRMSEELAAQEENSKESRKTSTAIALRLKTPFEVTPDQYYTYFIECIKNLLDGNMEASTFEDNLREMYGIHAFHAYTMDKLVISIVRVLHHLVSDECADIMDMYHEEQRNGATGGSASTQSSRLQAELNYQRRAEAFLADDNCCKFVFYKKTGDVCITLLDQNLDQGEEVAETERWASYIERYVSMTPTDGQQKFSDKMVKILRQKPLFMSRNIASWRRANLSPRRNEEEDDDEPEDSYDRDDINTHALELVRDVNDGKTMVSDGGGVRFTVNSLKMHHISWGSEMWYRRKALYNARNTHKTVSLTKHRKFQKWLENCDWHQELDKPEGASMEDACHDWMIGIGEEISPSTVTTVVKRNDPPLKPPYYFYYHYRVRRCAPPQPLTAAHNPILTSASVVGSHAMTIPGLLASAGISAPSPHEVMGLGSRPGSRPTSRPSSRPSTPAE